MSLRVLVASFYQHNRNRHSFETLFNGWNTLAELFQMLKPCRSSVIQCLMNVVIEDDLGLANQNVLFDDFKAMRGDFKATKATLKAPLWPITAAEEGAEGLKQVQQNHQMLIKNYQALLILLRLQKEQVTGLNLQQIIFNLIQANSLNIQILNDHDFLYEILQLNLPVDPVIFKQIVSYSISGQSFELFLKQNQKKLEKLLLLNNLQQQNQQLNLNNSYQFIDKIYLYILLQYKPTSFTFTTWFMANSFEKDFDAGDQSAHQKKINFQNVQKKKKKTNF